MRSVTAWIGFERSILIVSIAGLALRLAWWWYARPDPIADFEYYRLMAADLLEHHRLVDHPLVGTPRASALRVPGYPVFLALAMLVSRSVAWLSIVNVALSALLVPLVEEGWLEVHPARRFPLYSAVQKIVADAVPIVPLWHEDNVAITHRDVTGYRVLPNARYNGLVTVVKE